MNRFLRKGFLLIVAFAPALLIAQGTPQVQPFSADMKITSPRMNQPMNGKMFFDNGKIRMDMAMGQQNMSMIVDSATQTFDMLMHSQKMYMETQGQNMPGGVKFPDVRQYDPDHPCANREGYTCKKIGTETVNGRLCDKWIFTGPNGNQTVWIDQQLHFPIKNVNPDGSTFDLSNIQPGPQDASHFTIPPGYRKFDMGGGMGNRH